MSEWVSNIAASDGGAFGSMFPNHSSHPLRRDFHTGAVTTSAPQDLFRCVAEQLNLARTEMPQQYQHVLGVCLRAFTQYRHLQSQRMFTHGIETDVSMERVCSIANNLTTCVDLIETLRDDVDVSLLEEERGESLDEEMERLGEECMV